MASGVTDHDSQRPSRDGGRLAHVITPEEIDAWLADAEIRRTLLREGYDGIIVRDAGGDGLDYVIALDGRSVKLLRP